MSLLTIFLLVLFLGAVEDVQGVSQHTDDRSTLAALWADRAQKTVTTRQSLVSQAEGSAAAVAGTSSINRHFTLHSSHRAAVVTNSSHTPHNANQGPLNTNINETEMSHDESQDMAYTSTTGAQASRATNLGAVSNSTHHTQTDGLSTLDMSQDMLSECVRNNTTLELKEADVLIKYTLPGGTGSNSTLTHGPGTCWLNFTATPDQVLLISLCISMKDFRATFQPVKCFKQKHVNNEPSILSRLCSCRPPQETNHTVHIDQLTISATGDHDPP